LQTVTLGPDEDGECVVSVFKEEVKDLNYTGRMTINFDDANTLAYTHSWQGVYKDVKCSG
jgi:hypothetical protein